VLKNGNLSEKDVVLRLNEFGESGLAAGAPTPDVHQKEVDRLEGFCEPYAINRFMVGKPIPCAINDLKICGNILP
jgi:hypothetical protein